MQKGKGKEELVIKILEYCKSLKKLKQNEIFIFNIFTSNGYYQIKITPECNTKSAQRNKQKYSRKVEINGKMHHLFVGPRKIAIIPERKEIRYNLKGSVILKDITIHIEKNDNLKSNLNIKRKNRIQAKKYLNLAGPNGNKLIKRIHKNGNITEEAYSIIEDDILKAIK